MAAIKTPCCFDWAVGLSAELALVGDLYDFQFTKDAAYFMPHQTTHLRHIRHVMLTEKSPHVEIQMSLSIRIEAGNQENEISHTNSFHSE